MVEWSSPEHIGGDIYRIWRENQHHVLGDWKLTAEYQFVKRAGALISPLPSLQFSKDIPK